MLFSWVRIFYPKASGYPAYLLLATLVPQKIFGINFFAKWPMHFTSRALSPHKVVIGENTMPGWSPHCYIQGKNGIEIGSNLRMGPGVGLISANHKLDNYDEWEESEPIRIGHNVWLGINVVVMPGVQIGDNVVVGANSVVTKDLPSNSMAAGVPCKIIGEKAPYAGISYA